MAVPAVAESMPPDWLKLMNLVALLKMVADPALLASEKLMVPSLVISALPALLVFTRANWPLTSMTDRPALAELTNAIVPPPTMLNVGAAEPASTTTPSPLRTNVAPAGNAKV